MQIKQYFTLAVVFILTSLCFGQPLHAQTFPGGMQKITVPVTAGTSTRPALLSLPDDYAIGTRSYPLLIFLHGAGETGSADGSQLSKIYSNSVAGGPMYFIANGQWPQSFTNPRDGSTEKFIVVAPQATSWSTNALSLNYIIPYLVQQYRVDSDRIYLTGLSAGGDGIVSYTAHINGNVATPTTVTPTYPAAAIVVMSAAIGKPTQAMVDTTIASGVPVWGFGSESDSHGVNTHLYISGRYGVQTVGPAAPGLGSLGRFSVYNGGHCCWNTFYDPAYRESVGGSSMNIYQWMLQFSRGGGTGGVPVPSNTPPLANAGSGQTITLPTNEVILNGSGTDTDGTITSYAWEKISGASVTIAPPANASTHVTGFAQGTYTFRLTVTDNSGATDTDTVTVVVNAETILPPPPQPPAQGGKTITLPATTGGLSVSNFSSYNVAPCDTIVIPAGTYTSITLGSASGTPAAGIAGTARCPITIKNGGGQVIVRDYIRIYNATHFRLTGTGSPSYRYGFVTRNLAIANKTSDFEIDHIEAANANSGIGFWIKITPQATDPYTLYPNWVMRNISIHDTYVHDTNTEGMYIGHTDPSGAFYSNGLVPVQLENVKVYDNIVENTGWDGIQISNARSGAEIYNNTVKNYGTRQDPVQRNGIIFGGNTTGTVHNNTIVANGAGSQGGLAIFGYGSITVEDNELDNGTSSVSDTGTNIYINDPLLSKNPLYPPVNTNPGLRVTVRKNIIKKSSATTAIFNANYNRTELAGTIADNIICSTTSRSLGQLLVSNAGDSIFNNTLNAAVCTNTAPTPAPNIAPTANAGTDQTITLPTNSVILTGDGSDPDGSITAYTWTKVSGASATISSPTGKVTTVNGLARGVYVFKLTVTDTDGANSSDDMMVSVLGGSPVVQNKKPLVSISGSTQLTSSSVRLSATASDQDGTIRSVRWSQVAGPAPARILETTLAETEVQNLVAGVYVFLITATDNNGQSASDTISVTVEASGPSGGGSLGGGSSGSGSTGGGGGGSGGAGSGSGSSTTGDSVGDAGGGENKGERSPVTERVSVRASNLRVRQTPNGIIVTSVTNGTVASVIERSGEWLHVRFDTGTTGWIAAAYTIPATITSTGDGGSVRAQVTATVLNVRQSPNGEIITKVSRGTGGVVLADGGSWLHVRFDGGVEGWVSKAFTATSEILDTKPIPIGCGFGMRFNPLTGKPCAGVSPQQPILNATVTTTAVLLNVRAVPGGSILATVPTGTTATLIERTGAWVKVRFLSGVVGYVSAQYIR